MKLDFVGARPSVRSESLESAVTVISYFMGQPEEWQAGLQASSKIIYGDLWPGIDSINFGTAQLLKYNFVVHPGGDPYQIKLSYRGADEVKITDSGRLAISTAI